VPQLGRARGQPEDGDLAGLHLLHADDGAHQGGLAAAAGAEQAGHDPGLDGAADAVQDFFHPSVHDQVVHLDRVRHGRSLSGVRANSALWNSTLDELLSRHKHLADIPARRYERIDVVSSLDPAVAARLKRDAAGLVTAVVQQYDTGEVLMVGWMDDEALHRTLTTGRTTFWSRSRQAYWVKGETSGHTQHVKSVSLDCDGDALLVQVDQVGPACHTGERSCFHNPLGSAS
jgi:phosphoribosyl-AMP cyclohydrolase